MKRDAVVGEEFDWWAVDCDDHVALFSTAGYGEVPTDVLDAYGDPSAQPQLGTLLPLINFTTTWREVGRGPGTSDEFRQLGAHGMFVFDWRHWHGPYERIVRPDVAARVRDLPHLVRESVVLVGLRAVCFAEVAGVTPVEHVACG